MPYIAQYYCYIDVTGKIHYITRRNDSCKCNNDDLERVLVLVKECKPYVTEEMDEPSNVDALKRFIDLIKMTKNNE